MSGWYASYWNAFLIEGALTDLGRVPGVPPPSPHDQKFPQFYAVYLDIWAKLYVGAPPTGNPESTLGNA